MASRLFFSDVVRSMKEISMQISDNYAVYKKSNIEMDCDQENQTVCLSVDVFLDGYKKIKIKVHMISEDHKRRWYLNDNLVNESDVTYSKLVQYFKSFQRDMYNTLLFLRLEPESVNWRFELLQFTTNIIVTDTTTSNSIFRIDFSANNNLNKHTTGVVTFDMTNQSHSFNKYRELASLLYANQWIARQIKASPIITQTDQMWTAIHKLSNILERSSLTPSR